MSNYIYTNDGLVNVDDLMHYGVPGMKWGHRKNPYAGVPTNGSKRRAAEKAKQQMDAAKRNKRTANRAYDTAWRRANDYSSRHLVSQYIGKKQKAESNKRWDTATNAAKAANEATAKYKASKKAYKAAKKMANLEAKAVKEKYKQEYMKGESVVGRLYARYTGSHKIYADMMYDLNKGAYKKSK